MSTAHAIEQRSVALVDITPSRTNPRKHFGDMVDLVASVREKGVLQPVLLRPTPATASSGTYELVAGERRFRAALETDLAEIPAIIRPLSDAEALEVQVIENNQRADVHPLEEADGFRRLQDDHGYSVEQIAGKTGRSKGYVYARLQLCKLCEAGREAYFAGKLLAGVALIVARLPEANQATALVEFLPERRRWETEDPEPVTVAQASRYVRETFMLRLAQAPFALDDASLPGGACNVCPKRTGAQPELFADVAEADTCTDPACHAGKVDEVWKQRKAAAKAAKVKVLDDKEAKKIWPYDNNHMTSREYTALYDKHYVEGAGGSRTTREILGESYKVVAIARHPYSNALVELVDRAAVETVIRDLAPKKGKPAKALPAAKASAPAKAGASPKEIAEAAAAREKAKKEKEAEARRAAKAKLELEAKRKAAHAATAQIVARAEQGTVLDSEQLRAVATRTILPHSGKEIFERRGVAAVFIHDSAAQKWLAKLDQRALVGLVAESLLGGGLHAHSGKYSPELVDVCKDRKIDLKKLEDAARKELEAAQPAPVAKKSRGR